MRMESIVKTRRSFCSTRRSTARVATPGPVPRARHHPRARPPGPSPPPGPSLACVHFSRPLAPPPHLPPPPPPRSPPPPLPRDPGA